VTDPKEIAKRLVGRDPALRPMLSTKIHPPRRRDDLLQRPRLLTALATQPGPFVLVTGPAGSGKTVLVRQWLDQLDEHVGWLTVDPLDNDPARFWTYFAAAVSAGSASHSVAPGQSKSPEALATQLATMAPFLVVVDDLHFLVEGEVLAQLSQLIDFWPKNVRLVLISRAAPPLRLARRLACGELVEVRGSDLLFTEEETEKVLRRPARDPLAAAVQLSTGGWPVAVGFAALLPDADRHSTPTVRTRQRIADYLTQEVLRTQPSAVQDFLLDTSILDEITVGDANDICGTRDAALQLEHLDRHDIFLTRLDGTGVDTWRHHSLVRDHLRRTLERAQPDRWTHLHIQAARHFATREIPRAIGHALAAPDPDLAAELIEQVIENFDGPRSGDKVVTAQPLRWLEALPDRLFADHEALRLFGLSLAAAWARSDLVDRWLAARPAGGAVTLEDLFIKVWRADLEGDMPSCRDHALRALTMSKPQSPWWHYMYSMLAPAQHMLGDWEGEVRSLHELQAPLGDRITRGEGSVQEFYRALLVVIWSRQHAPIQVASSRQLLRDWLIEAASLGYRSEGWVDWCDAMVAYYSGDISTASRWEDLPDHSLFPDSPLDPIMLRLDQARIRRASGDRARAIVLLAEVRTRLSAYADPGRYPQWVALEEAALGIVPLQRAPAASIPPTLGTSTGGPLSPREQEVLQLLGSEFSLPEIAAHLFVSYNTAKTHTRTIYRKLGVRSRSAAVARGRILGYFS